MHETFIFPINCYSPQIPLTEPKILETELGIYFTDHKMDASVNYDAFEKAEIIPSLIELVERLNKTSNNYWPEDSKNINLIMKWVKCWGFLNASQEEFASKKFYGEKLSSFIEEAVKFHKLWNLYKAVANRDLNSLEKQIEIHEIEDENEIVFNENTFVFKFFGSEFYGGTTVSGFDEQNPIDSYQMASMFYLTEVIESYINEHQLHWSKMQCNSINNEDRIQITPGMSFPKLINALYMQFFILLTENTKKICPICDIPFSPERKDKVYCSETCKLTAKSRRYRESFKEKHGINYWEK